MELRLRSGTDNYLAHINTGRRPPIKLATREDPVETKSSAWIGEYNESMNCQVKEELVSQLVALNNKLNLRSPDLVHGDEERAEVQIQRENLYAEHFHTIEVDSKISCSLSRSDRSSHIKTV